MFKWRSCVFPFIYLFLNVLVSSEQIYDDNQRKCEPIQIKLCQDIGYNYTSMPNLLGNEVQSDVELTLQTFTPLIEYKCSPLLKLFLCASYVPMCAAKIPMHVIGPCQSLCEIVRFNCYPVLQTFGYPWPPALECAKFPRENNQDTMCMEGPKWEENNIVPDRGESQADTQITSFKCLGSTYSHLFVKLYRIGRCAPLCNADILFGQNEKHIAEVWVATWTFATLGLATLTIICKIIFQGYKNKHYASLFTSLFWCTGLVTVGWSIRFIVGRTSSACGIDPEVPDVQILLPDGLYNVFCTSQFLLRYYFEMAALAWWAIICLGWHRDVRRTISGKQNTSPAGKVQYGRSKSLYRNQSICAYEITQNNFSRFLAWGLPAFKTAAIIVTRTVDADELLGSCFVGNQSDRALQIFVATPIFCYWIFGTMNLISGYLIYRQHGNDIPKSDNGLGHFLGIECLVIGVILISAIYEFFNIDSWLNVPNYILLNKGTSTPMWPFLSRAFMELMLCAICSSWILGPLISTYFKKKFSAESVNAEQSIDTTRVHLKRFETNNSFKKGYVPNSNKSNYSREATVMLPLVNAPGHFFNTPSNHTSSTRKSRKPETYTIDII